MGSYVENHIPPVPLPSDASHTAENGYTILPQYHSQKRRLRVACVGAGATGKLEKSSVV